VNQDELKKGIIFMLMASFAFALTGACARYLRDDINPIQLVLFRNLIGVGFIIISLWSRPAQQQGGKLGLLIFRGIIGTLALYSFFYGISRIGLAVSITYQQSYPIFLSILVAWLYKEKLKSLEWMAIFIGFAGICLVFLPSIDASALSVQNHIIGISNSVMTGLAYLSIRGLSSYYDHRVIVLSFMLSGIVLPLISLSLGSFIDIESLKFIIDTFDTMRWSHLTPILILGFAALAGQIFLTKAFSYQKTGIIAAVGYSNIVFSIIFGIMLGDGLPDVISLLGIVLIILCGVMVSYSKKG
jgi:drug/metabolite transporter (DMT)-like permease